MQRPTVLHPCTRMMAHEYVVGRDYVAILSFPSFVSIAYHESGLIGALDGVM